jgi:hypothetical protein
MAKKVRGKLLADFHDVKVYAVLDRPKRSGKYRIWLSVRQNIPKRWRTFATLSYPYGLDLGFERVLTRQEASRLRMGKQALVRKARRARGK